MGKHVVIAGGGIGALEGLLALQEHAPLRISVVCPARHLAYRALSVREPFGAGPAPRYDWEEIAADRGVEWIPDAVAAVRPGARELVTREGPPLRFDALLLALGTRPGPVPAGTLPFSGPRDVLALREAIDALAPGRRHAVAFVAPEGVAWTLPLYELALLTAAHADARGVPLDIELVTAEPDPLAVFGAAASVAVGTRMAAAGIRVRSGAPDPRAELTVALPRLRGPALDGLPADADGFVPVDPYGRVRGVDAVWAVGDMTTHPVRQGGLAAQQADVAAADIAARVAGAPVRVAPFRPTLRGMLLTGEAPLFLERTRSAPGRSAASERLLWSPPAKIAGRRLGRYLAELDARAELRASRSGSGPRTAS